MQSRIQWSGELAVKVSGTFRSMENRYMMVMGRPSHGINTTFLGWMQVSTIDRGAVAQNRERLSAVIGAVQSPVALGSAQYYAVVVFAPRRDRTATARGLCYSGEKKEENVKIIKPKEQQESEKKKKVVKEDIDIKTMSIGVSNLRKGGKGTIILGGESEQELTQLKSNVSKLGDKYQITEPKGAQPKLKILNLYEGKAKYDEDQIDMIIVVPTSDGSTSHFEEKHSDLSRECPTFKKALEEEKKKIGWTNDE
ncbi:hypothetical protein ANTPLA_LOCUS1940 [Anthophora plagiata]